MRASGLFLLQCLLWVFGAAPSHADAPVPDAAAAAAPTVLTLEGLLARVDDPGGPLEAARGELAAYQALYDRAYWSWLPTLKLESLMAPLPERRLLEECAYNDSTLDPGLLRVGPCPGARPADDERIDADTDIGILTRSRATLTLPLYTFGKFSAGRRAAEGGLEVGRATLEATQGQVSLMVKRAWYGAQMTASALEILEDGRKRLQTAKRQIEKELADETGRFTTNDLRKLLVKEAELEAGYLETRALSDYAWEGLRLAAGAPQGARLELAEKALPEVQVVERDVDGWMNLAGSHRADVRLVDAGFRARQGQVDLATAEFFPDIALVAAFGYARGTSAMDNPDPFANDQYNFLSWGFVVGAEWKLDFAARMGKLREAEANLSKLRGQRDALRQKMRLEIVEELGTVRRYTAELESRRQAMKAGKGWLVSNTMNFGIGLATTDELLDSLVAYSSARLSYFRTLFELNIAVGRLQNAVGVAVVVPPPTTNP